MLEPLPTPERLTVTGGRCSGVRRPATALAFALAFALSACAPEPSPTPFVDGTTTALTPGAPTTRKGTRGADAPESFSTLRSPTPMCQTVYDDPVGTERAGAHVTRVDTGEEVARSNAAGELEPSGWQADCE